MSADVRADLRRRLIGAGIVESHAVMIASTVELRDGVPTIEVGGDRRRLKAWFRSAGASISVPHKQAISDALTATGFGASRAEFPARGLVSRIDEHARCLHAVQDAEALAALRMAATNLRGGGRRPLPPDTDPLTIALTMTNYSRRRWLARYGY